MFLLGRAWSYLRCQVAFYYTFHLRCHGDDVEYLRYLGVRIGRGCSVYTNPESFGTEPWLIEIGDNVTLGQSVRFVTHDGASRLFRGAFPEMSPFGNRFGTIVIHDNCFVGDYAILLPGVEIGPDSIVGAGSVVTKAVPACTVVAGNPAKPIESLDEYVASYRERMISLTAKDRVSLRRELTMRLWGESR